MGRGRRVKHQGIDITQRGGRLEDRQGLHEAEDLCLIGPIQLKRHYAFASPAFKKRLDQGMLRMIGESGKIDILYAWMFLKPLGHLLRIPALLCHS
jgi:hypothetical protein